MNENIAFNNVDGRWLKKKNLEWKGTVVRVCEQQLQGKLRSVDLLMGEVGL